MKTYIKKGETLKANYTVQLTDLISETGDRNLKKSDYKSTHKVEISFNGVDYDNEFIGIYTQTMKTHRYSIKFIHPKTGFTCGDSHKMVISFLAS